MSYTQGMGIGHAVVDSTATRDDEFSLSKIIELFHPSRQLSTLSFLLGSGSPSLIVLFSASNAFGNFRCGSPRTCLLYKTTEVATMIGTDHIMVRILRCCRVSFAMAVDGRFVTEEFIT